MKPARSPRFQSPALRSSMAAISACGSPGATLGAEQASMASAVHVQGPRPLVTGIVWKLRSRDANVPRERPEEMARAIQRGAPALSRRSVLAAALPRRLPPLRLAAPLRPGLRPLLAGLLLRLGSRRLSPLLRRLRPRRRHRLVPHRRRSGRRHGCRRVHTPHHPRGTPAALRKNRWREHRMISPLLVVGGGGLLLTPGML